MSTTPLRLGLLLDSMQVPAWIYTAIERTVRSGEAEVRVVVLRQGGKKPAGREKLIPRLYQAVDERVFVRGNRATGLKNIGALIPRAEVMRVRPLDDRAGCLFDAADVENIRRHDLDLLVRIGFEGLCGEILASARYGVWDYFSARAPHGYWEVLEGMAETRLSLRRLSGAAGPAEVLFSAASLTYPFSPARNRNRSLWKGASFLPREIHRLYRSGGEAYLRRMDHGGPVDADLQKDDLPLLKHLGLLIKLMWKNGVEMISRKFRRDAWFLMVDPNGTEGSSFQAYRALTPPRDHFWADPYVIQKDGKYFIFIEEFDARKGKGHISVMTMDAAGTPCQPVPVLERPYHLSYPCVFQWKDRYYMVPESSDNRTIDLYECVEFPNRWEHRQTLMEGVRAFDSTLIFYQGKWWLFTGLAENEGSAPEVELFLFHSDHLLSREWTPHPLNPLKSDAGNARPAGGIFVKDGKLYRPSQDCSVSYGHGFDLNEILVLSDTEYAERCVRSVRPDWDKKITATHTYGTAGPFQIIDAYTTRTIFERR